MTILLGNFVRTQLDATWTSGNYEPLPGDWQSLDQKIMQSVNGANGGCWSMASGQTTTIAGSGLILLSPLVVQGGGILETAGGASKVILNDAADYPELAVGHPGRTQVIGVDPLEATWAPFYAWSRYDAGNVSGLQSVALAMKNPDGTVSTPEFFLPLRAHNGGTIASVQLNFRVPFQRSQAPIAMPKVRVIRRDASGNVTPLRGQTVDAAGLTADASGFVSQAKVTSAATWYANGAVQSLTVYCDQNNVVDASLYSYFLHVVEEGMGASGLTATWPLAATIKAPARACDALDNALVSGTTTADGVTLANNDRVLLTTSRASGGTNQPAAGIYANPTVGSGTWARTTDLDEASEYVQGVVVPVTAGLVYGGSAWIVTTPGAIILEKTAVSWAQIGDFTAKDPTDFFPAYLSQQPPVLGGNVYVGAQTTCLITDTRPE